MTKIIKILAFISLILCGCDDKNIAVIGSPAPKISAKDINNEKVNLKPNKVNVLLFWQYGCAGCTKAIPDFEKMLEKKGDKFEVIAINSVNSDDVIFDFQKDMNLKNVKIASDNLKITSERYEVKTLPMIFVIDQNNTLNSEFKGDLPWKYIEAKLSSFY